MTVSVLAQLMPVTIAGALEGVGVPWPGVVVIAGAGMAAGDSWTALAALTALFAVCYSVGALGQYAIGRVLGPVALSWLPAAKRRRIDRLMTKHGSAAVLWSRPLAVGNYVSAPAGMMRMPVVRFLWATLAGIVPWAFVVLLIGTTVGNRFGDVQDAVSAFMLPAVTAIGAAAVMVMGVKLARRRRGSIIGRPGPADENL